MRHGFDARGHLSLIYGFDTSIQANVERFAALGLDVAVTKADVRVPIPPVGGPTPEKVVLHAERHDAMLEACLDVPSCTSFTVWGFPDSKSWVPSVFAVRTGRRSSPTTTARSRPTTPRWPRSASHPGRLAALRPLSVGPSRDSRRDLPVPVQARCCR